MQENEPEKITVPWKGVDVLLFLALTWMAVLMSIFIGYLGCFLHPLPQVEHWSELLQASKNGLIVSLIIFFAVTVVGPLCEEFVFRLLLQGWLEAKCRQFRVPYASGVAIVTASFVFAVSHGAGIFAIPTQAVYLYGSSLVLCLLIIAFGVVYLMKIRNVKITRCLFGTERFFRPRFFVGVGYCLLAILVLFTLSGILFWGIGINYKIVNMFFLSLILGTLYSKTRNLSYCVLLHGSLNGILISVILFL